MSRDVSNPDIYLGDEPEGEFSSVDSELIILDGPGDTTVRPVPPARRAQLEALKATIAFWEAYRKEQAAKEQSNGKSKADNSET